MSFNGENSIHQLFHYFIKYLALPTLKQYCEIRNQKLSIIKKYNSTRVFLEISKALFAQNLVQKLRFTFLK